MKMLKVTCAQALRNSEAGSLLQQETIRLRYLGAPVCETSGSGKRDHLAAYVPCPSPATLDSRRPYPLSWERPSVPTLNPPCLLRSAFTANRLANAPLGPNTQRKHHTPTRRPILLSCFPARCISAASDAVSGSV